MSTIQLKGGFLTRDRRLNRIPSFDEQSRQYKIRSLIVEKTPRSFTWACNLWLDQGQEGACTGFATTHEAAARPVVVQSLTYETAYGVYQRAKQLDEWPGEDYEGSSVLAAVKAGKERGWYKQYRWAFGIDDLILALGYSGPAILGINWYDGMFDTDAKGFVSPGITRLAGGHAILAMAVSMKQEYVMLHNSWGKENFGMFGRCKVTFKDMDRLLREQGEACVPVQRTQPPKIGASLEAPVQVVSKPKAKKAA